jgi:hypothetical protein
MFLSQTKIIFFGGGGTPQKLDKVYELRFIMVFPDVVPLSASSGAISKLTIWSPSFAGFCQLNWQVQGNVVKTLQPVLGFSCDDFLQFIYLFIKTK